MDEHRDHPSPQARLRRLIALERKDLWTVVAFSMGAGLMALATPIAVQSLVNTIAFGALLQPLFVLVVILFGSLALNNLLIAFQIYVVEMMQRRIFVRLLGDIAGRLQRVVREAFDGRNGPELVNRFFDVLTVQKSAAVLLLDGLAYGLQAVIGMLLLAFYHPFLLAFDILLILAVMFIFFVLGRHGVATSIQESRAKYAVAAWLEEIARNPMLFKWAGSPEFVAHFSDNVARDYLSAATAHFSVVMRQHIGVLFLHTLANTALLGLGGWMVIERQLTLGQLIAAELVVNAMLVGLSRLGKSLQSYYELMAAMDKLGHLLDLPQERQSGEVLGHSGGPAAVSLHRVSFRYGNGSGRDIFSGLEAQVHPGERIAVVGRSGAGRGTLLELLFGLRTPTDGTVQVDGFDIRDLKLDSVRREIALVKGMEILEGSVLENIRMGRNDIGMAEVREVLAGLRLDDDVLGLPEGLNTPLNYLGVPLSPEKARRLVMARALVGQPRLLLVHEMLDALDAGISDSVIRWVLRRDAPWTAIVATQSAAVVASCDRIWRLEGGRILEQELSAEVPGLPADRGGEETFRRGPSDRTLD
jgi:ABC-type bacteriocin/lantibiotic exporter with double-glycine peptidase domain